MTFVFCRSLRIEIEFKGLILVLIISFFFFNLFNSERNSCGGYIVVQCTGLREGETHDKCGLAKERQIAWE